MHTVDKKIIPNAPMLNFQPAQIIMLVFHLHFSCTFLPQEVLVGTEQVANTALA